MEITEIRLRKVNSEKNPKLKATVSVTFDKEFVVHNIRVSERDDGTMIASMPNRYNKSTGKYKYYAHPINQEFREKLEKAIFEEYENAPEPTENDGEEETDSEDK